MRKHKDTLGIFLMLVVPIVFGYLYFTDHLSSTNLYLWGKFVLIVLAVNVISAVAVRLSKRSPRDKFMFYLVVCYPLLLLVQIAAYLFSDYGIILNAIFIISLLCLATLRFRKHLSSLP